MKRLLFTFHRWLGIGLGVFMLLWFFSGLVMVYSGSTAVTREDHLSHARPLEDVSHCLSLEEVWRISAAQRSASSLGGKPAKTEHSRAPGQHRRDAASSSEKSMRDEVVEARLSLVNNTPVWQVEDGQGRRHALSALNGQVLEVSPETAVQIALAWGGKDVTPRFMETLERDRGMRMMSLDAYRPLHKIALGDEAGTELDISSRTGDVLNASSRLQRAMNYAGSWLHFFRPLDSVGLGEQRKAILTWGAFIACFAALTGLIAGWLRWRPGWLGARTYEDGRTQPYRAPWPRWHFWLGLAGGLVTLTWIASGFLANNPWQMFSRPQPTRDELARFQAGPIPPDMLALRPESLLPPNRSIVEISLRVVGDQRVILAYDATGTALPAGQGRPASIGEKILLDAAIRVLPGAAIKTHALLLEYDNYYYPSHRRAVSEKPLPVLRVELDDPASHWLYIDPIEGRLLVKIDRSRRVYRWVFSALHNWDFAWLYRRPVWDIWMASWSLVGLALSLTSLVIGWRRLKRYALRAGKSKKTADDISSVSTSTIPSIYFPTGENKS